MTPRFALLSLLSVVVFCLPSRLSAQTTQAEAEARLLGKPLYLRVPVDGDKLKFGPDGRVQGTHFPMSFTEAGVDATRVQISGDRMKIEGTRMATTFDRQGEPTRIPFLVGKKNNAKPQKISIEIDNHGNQNFGPVLSAVFADGLSEVATSVPEYWVKFMSKFLSTGEKETREIGPPICSKTTERVSGSKSLPVTISDTCTEEKPFHIGGGVKPPKVLHMEDPEFSETARNQRFSGNVMVYLIIDEQGRPTRIRIVRPAGMGLDERAIEAVSQYKFRPATRDGQPVVVDMNIEVNFQIF